MMNRRKKINQTLKSKAKKANAKLHRSNKPAYISKAQRAQFAEQSAENSAEVNEPEWVLTCHCFSVCAKSKH